jgi:acyl carrier protein
VNERTADLILDDLTGIFRNFHGREFSGPIGSETLFFADLGLASIDAVVLGETLESHYGRRLPFGELLGELGQRSNRDLRLSELVSFLQTHLNQPA